MGYTDRVKHQYKILKELHGSKETDSILKSLANEFRLNEEDILQIVHGEFDQPIQYGLVIGRFQPFHFGHQHIINEILLDGKTPIVLIGDDGGKDTEKNPLSVAQRMELIEQVFPDICIKVSVEDQPDWDEWFEKVVRTLSMFSRTENVTLYFHNKECDRYDYFSHRGKEYYNEFYTKIYEDAGFNLRPVQFVERSDIVIDADARNIRDDFEAFKHLMDGRNYWKLKEWGW